MPSAATQPASSPVLESSAITPARAPSLGIIGGGQLARMTALAAAPLGCEVVVMERSEPCPAAQVAVQSLVGDYNQAVDLARLAEACNLLTLENEFVDAGALAEMERNGCLLFPTSRTMALVQDKFIQKQTLAAAGLPLPAFRTVETPDEVADAAAQLGWPLVLKARRNGYDGKGNATVRSVADVPGAWKKLGGDRGNPLFVEAFCPFIKELAIIITTGRDGSQATYPLVETTQRDHICHVVQAPVQVDEGIASKASDIARRAVAAVAAVGSFGVEMFLTEDGVVLVNELAPRVHNSGHYTIEACECSQFENHVRAVLGWPLGSTAMVAPAAVMINLLGAGAGPGQPTGLAQALAVPGAHVHLYGKAVSAKGRKMGHVTALGASVEQAMSTARTAAGLIQFGTPQ